MSSPAGNREPPSFEDVLEKLGGVGKFQLIQICLIYMAQLPMAFNIMSFVFLGYPPPHVCNTVNETHHLSNYEALNGTNPQIRYHSCDIQVLANASSGQMVQVDSVPCPDGRDFGDAKHTTWISEWDLVCDSKGVAELSQTFFNIGQLVGGLLGAYVTDRFGRKLTLVGSSLLSCLVELCLVAAPNIFVVYGFKLFSGFFYQAIVCCYFVYATEFVTPRNREANGVFVCILWVTNVIVVGGVAYFLKDLDWKYFQGAIGASGILVLVYPFVLYESPRWLAANGRHEEALAVLKKASETNGKDFNRVKETFNAYIQHAFPSTTQTELLLPGSPEATLGEPVVVDGKGKSNTKPSVMSLLRNKSLRKITLISWYLFTTNSLTYFGLYMTSSNVAGDRFLNYTLMSVVEYPCCLCIFLMMKRMSRRMVMEIFLVLTSLSLMSSGLIITFAEESQFSASMVTALFIFGKFSISASYNVVYIVVPELFPTNLRSTASGFCMGLSRIGPMLAPFMRPLFEIAKWGPALIFSSMCLVAAVMTMFLPESKDVGLPDTIDDIDGKKKQRKPLDLNDDTKL